MDSWAERTLRFLSLSSVMMISIKAATPRATGTKMTSHVGLSTQFD